MFITTTQPNAKSNILIANQENSDKIQCDENILSYFIYGFEYNMINDANTM